MLTKELNCLLSKVFNFLNQKKILTTNKIRKHIEKKSNNGKKFRIESTLYQSFDDLGGKWSDNWTDVFDNILKKIEKNLRRDKNYYDKINQRDASLPSDGRYEYGFLTDDNDDMLVFFIVEGNIYKIYCIMKKDPNYIRIRSNYFP